MTAYPPTPPETRDWTVVLDEGCDECGYAPHVPATTGQRLTAAAGRWRVVLDRVDAAERPDPQVWSPSEYAGHSRDLVRVLGERVRLMLTEDDPTFADFDSQGEVERGGYGELDPEVLADDIDAVTATTVEVLGAVAPEDWERTGRRSDGFAFTVATLCQYLLHDVEHHLVDARG